MVMTMTTECSSTADAMTGVLMAGDVFLNLSQQPLNTIADTLFVAADEDRLTIRHTPSSVQWRLGTARSLQKRRFNPSCTGDCCRLSARQI
jgi:hypothetical protein